MPGLRGRLFFFGFFTGSLGSGSPQDSWDGMFRKIQNGFGKWTAGKNGEWVGDVLTTPPKNYISKQNNNHH